MPPVITILAALSWLLFVFGFIQSQELKSWVHDHMPYSWNWNEWGAVFISAFFRCAISLVLNGHEWHRHSVRHQHAVHWKESFFQSCVFFLARFISLPSASCQSFLLRRLNRFGLVVDPASHNRSPRSIPGSLSIVALVWGASIWLVLASLASPLLIFPLVLLHTLFHLSRSGDSFAPVHASISPFSILSVVIPLFLDMVVLVLILPAWIWPWPVLILLVQWFSQWGFPLRGLGLREWILIQFCIAIKLPPDLHAPIVIHFGLTYSLAWILCFFSCGIWYSRRYRPATFPDPSIDPGASPISVIIPARNEAQEISQTIQRLKNSSLVGEILVVDGMSDDSTAEIARSLGCTVYTSKPSRGAQMRLGSLKAHSDILFFCHADTWVEPGFDQAILRCLKDPEVVWGGMWKQFRNPHWIMRGSRFRCWLRWIISRRVLGDQGIFIRRSALIAIGGFPDVPLMEEFELARRLHPIGSMALADANVLTSTRKFLKLGILRTYWRMALVTFLYYCGTSHDKLNEIYRKS